MNRAVESARWTVRLGVAVAAALLVLLGVQQAIQYTAAQPVTGHVRFDGLLPAQVRTETDSITIERAGVLRSFSWSERTGIVADSELTVRLCLADAACAPIPELLGRTMPAGEYALEVTLTAPESLEPGSVGSGLGVLVLTGETSVDGPVPPLPATGVAGLGALVLLALGLVTLGGRLSARRAAS